MLDKEFEQKCCVLMYVKPHLVLSNCWWLLVGVGGLG